LLVPVDLPQLEEGIPVVEHFPEMLEVSFRVALAHDGRTPRKKDDLAPLLYRLW
jgi:hypothetical protein